MTLKQIDPDSSALGNSAMAAAQEASLQETVYTPVSNVIIMALNLLLAMLTLQITFNIDYQIDHIQVPTFMS